MYKFPSSSTKQFFLMETAWNLEHWTIPCRSDLFHRRNEDKNGIFIPGEWCVCSSQDSSWAKESFEYLGIIFLSVVRYFTVVVLRDAVVDFLLLSLTSTTTSFLAKKAEYSDTNEQTKKMSLQIYTLNNVFPSTLQSNSHSSSDLLWESFGLTKHEIFPCYGVLMLF